MNDTPFHWLWDLLTFRAVISPALLMLTYYAGAIGMPISLWLLWKHGKERIAATPQGQRVNSVVGEFVQWVRSRPYVTPVLIVVFISMELVWRMLFEFLIAWFQMREALLQLSGHY